MQDAPLGERKLAVNILENFLVAELEGDALGADDLADELFVDEVFQNRDELVLLFSRERSHHVERCAVEEEREQIKNAALFRRQRHDADADRVAHVRRDVGHRAVELEVVDRFDDEKGVALSLAEELLAQRRRGKAVRQQKVCKLPRLVHRKARQLELRQKARSLHLLQKAAHILVPLVADAEKEQDAVVFVRGQDIADQRDRHTVCPLEIVKVEDHPLRV